VDGVLRHIQGRARGFSRAALAVYACVLALLSFAHHCELTGPSHSAGEMPPGVHAIHQDAENGPGEQPCFACSWQRTTLGAALLSPNRVLPVPVRQPALNTPQPALLGCISRLPATRGPPSA
jgi:hypothetical protein